MYHIPLALQCMYVYMDAVKLGMGRMEVRFLEEGREWRLPHMQITWFCVGSWRKFEIHMDGVQLD